MVYDGALQKHKPGFDSLSCCTGPENRASKRQPGSRMVGWPRSDGGRLIHASNTSCNVGHATLTVGCGISRGPIAG